MNGLKFENFSTLSAAYTKSLYRNDPDNEFVLKEDPIPFKDLQPLFKKIISKEEVDEKILRRQDHVDLLEMQKNHAKTGKAGRVKKSNLTAQIAFHKSEIEDLQRQRSLRSTCKVRFSSSEDILCPVYHREFYKKEKLIKTLWTTVGDETRFIKNAQNELNKFLAKNPNTTRSEAEKKLYQP